jgi:hypothetical protein
MSTMSNHTCYQPHPADPYGADVAHAIDNADPNVSVAGERLSEAMRGKFTTDVWPGRGPACSSCADAFGR